MAMKTDITLKEAADVYLVFDAGRLSQTGTPFALIFTHYHFGSAFSARGTGLLFFFFWSDEQIQEKLRIVE